MTSLQQRAHRIVLGVSFFVTIVGMLVLLGWYLDVAWLKSVLPNAVTMKPNTALCFVLAGIPLWLLVSPRATGKTSVWVGWAYAMLVALIATLTLAQYLFGFNAHIDTALFPDLPGDPQASHVGRMAPATAAAFLLSSIALMLMRSHRGWSLALAQSAAMITLLIGLIAILGYLYGVDQLHQFYSYTSVALHTAVLLTVLGVGIVLVRIDYGLAAMMTSADGGGFLARRIFPAAVLLPFFFGWLRLKGQYAGYYDLAFGVALLTAANITIFVGLIWLTARALNRKDAERRSVQEALRQSGERLRNIVDGLGPSMFVGLLDLEGVVLEANQQALAAAGLKREDVLGQAVEETYWFSYAEASKQQMRDMIARGVRGEATRCDLEIRVAENQYIDLDFSMQPYRDASGNVTLLVPSAIVITERKRAENALRESQHTLQLTLDAAQIGHWDLDLRTLAASRSLRHDQIFGYSALRADWSYETFLSHVFPEDKARVDKLFNDGVAAKTQWDFECRIIRADGALRWIWVHGKVFTNVADEAVRMLGMVSDISERKEAEAALRAADQRAATILETMSDAFVTWDAAWRYTYVNAAAERTLSHPREDLLGRNVLELFHPELDDPQRLHYQRAMTERMTASFEMFHPLLDIWVEVRAYPRDDGGLSVFFRDVTARIQQVNALRESESRYRLLVQNSPYCVHEIDTEGRLISMNPAGLKMMCVEEETAICGLNYVDAVGESDRERVKRLLGQALQGQPSEFEFLAANNSIFQSSLVPIRDESGTVLRLMGLTQDITERKRAERALQESEVRLRLALDAAHMGTFDWDRPNNHVNQSRWHEELWGFKPGEFNGTYEALLERIHPDDLPKVDAEVARCMATREPFVREFRVVWPDGSTHWIASHGEFTFDADGQPSRMHGVVREITALKRAEILLSGEKTVLEMMAEGAPLRTILETITRNVEADANDTQCSILLLDADGAHLLHGAAPSLPESYNRAIHGAAIGPKAGSCGTAVYRNQPVIVTDIATDPLWDDYRALALPHGLRACWSTPIRSAGGQVLGSFALYYHAPRAPSPADFELIARVTHLSAIAIERRHAERALQESEERLRLALEAARMGTFDWDIPNNHIAWSHWHEALWGYKPGEFGGTYEAFSERVHPDDLGAIDAEIAHCIAKRKPYHGEFRVVWPDGSVHWISVRGEFTFGADHQPQRMRGAVVEITERKQAEAGLLEAKQQMERKVIERTAELQAIQLELHAKNEELSKQNRRVEEANRLKSEFLANMSHELRTPLNAIIGFSELMHDGKVGPIASNHKEYLGDVLTSAQHLLHLINDVLDLAKVESGKMEFHYAPMDLRKVIGEVCEILRTMTSRTRVQVAIDIDKELSEVWGDASKLKQVLYNYLSNALKFSPEGGQVRVRAKREGQDAYRIEVEDQGIGIKAEDIPRLFQEFQQLDLSASKKYQGTGLGLALTKRIIAAQGGQVGVESIRGRGSIFYAILPLKSAAKGSTLSVTHPGV